MKTCSFFIDEDDFKEVNASGEKIVILLNGSITLNSLNGRLLKNFILELIIVETLLQERISP
jgi:hypothetical protein